MVVVVVVVVQGSAAGTELFYLLFPRQQFALHLDVTQARFSYLGSGREGRVGLVTSCSSVCVRLGLRPSDGREWQTPHAAVAALVGLPVEGGVHFPSPCPFRA